MLQPSKLRFRISQKALVLLIALFTFTLMTACSVSDRDVKKSISPANSIVILETLGVKSISEISFKLTPLNTTSGYFDGTTNVETINKTSKPALIKLWGWAIIPEEGRLADLAIITQNNNSLIAVAPVYHERRDVANASNNPAYMYSGWIAKINLSTLSVDKMLLKAWAYNYDKKEAIQLDRTHELVVSTKTSKNINSDKNA